MNDCLQSDIDLEEEKEVTVCNDLQFNIINTNAISMCPKINSLLDCFDEMSLSLAVVTETWLSDGAGLEDDLDDLMEGAGVGICLLYTSPSPRD